MGSGVNLIKLFQLVLGLNKLVRLYLESLFSRVKILRLRLAALKVLH
jgi:hypothetical protein